MIKLPISSINFYSNFYKKFTDGESFIESRFRSRNLLDDETYLQKKAQSFSARKRSLQIISKSMQNLHLTDKQTQNLNSITQHNTLFVTAGQQVGFLGGPLYTALKIATTISWAKRLKLRHPKLNFLPLFWLEDNDHDIKEASEINIFDTNYNPKFFSCKLNSSPNTPTSQLQFTNEINSIIEDVINSLPHSAEKPNTTEFLKSIYVPQKNWSQAMLDFYQEIFATDGLLFARSSECRETGAVQELARINFAHRTNATELFEILSLSKAILKEEGFKVSINLDYFNYCKHTDGHRYSIKTTDKLNVFSINNVEFDYDAIISDINLHPENYSPKAILRPIFQEICFPSALYVLGPGELEYHSVLKEAYDFFKVDFPPVASRAVACFLQPRYSDFLREEELPIEAFFKQNNDFEHFLSEIVEPDFSENIFSSVKVDLEEVFSKLSPVLKEAEPSLERTNYAYKHKTFELIDNLHKKYVSALKKKNSDKITKLRKIRNIILPNEHLQERSISPLNFINFYGSKNFAKILNEIADNFVKDFVIYS